MCDGMASIPLRYGTGFQALKRGSTVKIFATAAALLLALGAALPAGAIEIVNNPHARIAAEQAARLPDLAPVPAAILLPTGQSSELPEPEVFAMMLLGLVLIGWRASRDSTEKFK